MPEYAIKFTDPAGAVSYWPENFGFGVHKHAEELAGAKRFSDPEAAQRSLLSYINPPAFWNSEREHASRMREQFRRWKCEIIQIEA
jgi:hypothetical protein